MTLYNTPLPHDDIAEISLLSACLQDAQSLFDASEILTPQAFYSAKNQRIFKVLLESSLNIENKPPEFAVVASKLNEQGVATSDLMKLFDEPMAVDIPSIAKIIRDKANLRNIIKTSLAGISKLMGTNGDSEGSILEFQNSILNAVPEIPDDPKRKLSGKAGDTLLYFDIDEAFDKIDSNNSEDSNNSNNSEDSPGVKQTANTAKNKKDSKKTAGKQQGVRSLHSETDKNIQNLAGLIKEWVTNSTGSFTIDQIDREFCLITRADKNNRANALRACIDKKLINRDKRIKGKYHIIDASLKVVDIFDTDETPFKLKLPFMLDNYVSIPKKAIIILAGSSNAGKTAIIMNILKLNLSQEYQKFYLMSEMGVGEYVERIRNFDDIPFIEWKKVMAAERSSDFNGVIEHHNKNGLTCIDFLEEVEGEYFKISSDIRSIYDALGDGVAIVAIQKKTDTDYARGGQATAEKSRLYLSVDYLTQTDQSIICALKTIKVKRYIGGRNIQGHEIHFKISGGSKIEPVSDWVRCTDVDRKRCIDIYNQPDTYKKRAASYCYEFKTDTGRIRGINEKCLAEWEKNFSSIDVKDTLEDIANDSFKRAFLSDRSWFFQVATILNDKNEKRGEK